MPKTAKSKPHVSTVNALIEDIGFSPEEAAVLRLKTMLHVEIMKVVEKRKLSQ